jgi:hypothetical protein
MAISTNSVWEIRSSGSDTNGGVWDSTLASAGTDLSQSATPALSLTDVATTSTTTVTSATGGFLAAHIANGINIAGTVYQITAVASTNSITVDRATGTGTGQTGKVGGACASPGYVASQIVAGNWVYWGPGTYIGGTGTVSTSGNKVLLSAGGTLTRQMRWIGYNTARGDFSGGPLFQSAGGATTLFSTSSAANIVILDNIVGDGINASNPIFQSNTSHRLVRCKAMRTTGVGFSASVNGTSYRKCEATACGTGASGRVLARACNFHGCTGVGVAVTSGPASISRCAMYANGSHGLTATGEIQVSDCTMYGNTGSGSVTTITTTAVAEYYNCLAYGNGATGFANGNTNDTIFTYDCGVGNNTSGNFSATVTQENTITLTADPFNNAAGADFSLNVAAGGGALLRGTGDPGVLPGSASTGYPDIGAVQHAGSSQFGIVRPPGSWSYIG